MRVPGFVEFEKPLPVPPKVPPPALALNGSDKISVDIARHVQFCVR